MKKITGAIVICLSCLSLTGQNSDHVTMSALSGSRTVCSQYGVNSVFCNPAGLSQISKSFFITTFSDDYSIHDLWNIVTGYIFKTNKGALPLTITSKGPRDCVEFGLSTGYSLELSERFYAGIMTNARYFLIRDIQDEAEISLVFGIQYRANEKLTFGMMCETPAVILKDRPVNYSCFVLKSAVSYYFTSSCGVSFEISKTMLLPVVFSGLFEIALSERIRLVSGYKSGANELFCGLSVLCPKMTFMMSASYNFMLGTTPEIVFIR